MAFHVGQKVVCVDEKPRPDRTFGETEALRRGAIYTVLRTFVNDDGVPCLHLNEVARDEVCIEYYGYDVGYGAWRFRPVVERKTDIGFAHEILRKVTKRQGADA